MVSNWPVSLAIPITGLFSVNNVHFRQFYGTEEVIGSIPIWSTKTSYLKPANCTERKRAPVLAVARSQFSFSTLSVFWVTALWRT